jgi:hypothetical protein
MIDDERSALFCLRIDGIPRDELKIDGGGTMKRQRGDHFVRKIADAWKMEE